jgi:DNA ligase-1
MVNKGWEGMYLKHKTHTQRAGKRVNDAIKLKFRATADLLCVDMEPGEGKYEGMIGSLILRDSEGRLVSVGSGLNDIDRQRPDMYFINKVIEIEYEQIIDTYIQPTFVRIREDKREWEID